MRNIILILITFLAAIASPCAVQGQNPVILKTDSVQIACESKDTFLFPIRVRNFTGVASFQFTLNFNPAQLDYAYITTGANNPFFSGNFSADFDTTSFINQGRLTFAWTRVGGASFADNTPVFFVAFRRIGGFFSPVTFGNVPVVIEVTDKNAEELPYKLEMGGVVPIDAVKPSITCPPNLTLQANGPTVVNNIAPVAVSDNCLPPQQTGWSSVGATVANFPNSGNASGSVFNLGLSEVTYKVTDVGGNTSTCSFKITIEPTLSNDTLTLVASNGNASCGTPFSVPINAINFDSVGSIQFSLQWDKAILKFDSISVIGAGLKTNAGDFNTSQAISNGRLTFSWTSPSSLTGGTTIPNGALLFRLHFSIVGNSASLSSIQFTDVPTVREVFKATLPPDEMPAIWISGQITVQDKTPPNLVCPQNISVATAPGDLSANVNNTAPTTLNDACSPNTTLTFVSAGATNKNGTGSANGVYDAGNSVVTYTATDASGNSTTCSFNIFIDAGKPTVLALDTVEIGCAGGALTEFKVNVTVENFADIIGLQYSVKWDSAAICLTSVTNIFPGLNLQANALIFADTAKGIFRFLGGAIGATPNWPDIPDGGTFFTLNFKVKKPGATSPLEFLGPFDAVNGVFNTVPLLTINGGFKSGADLNGPTFLNCPKDSVNTLPPGQCQIALLYKLNLTDDCSGVDTLTSNFPTGVFPSGTNNVVYTATDSVGNTSTCAFKVIVNLTNDLKLNKCPQGTITANVPDNACEVAISWTVPEIVGVCDVGAVKLNTNVQPGTLFKVNDPRLVQYVAVDTINSTIATCQFTVEALDKTAPAITCPKDTVITPLTGCEAKVDFKLPLATDNCDTQVEVKGTAMPNDTFPVGTTIVTLTATDDSKNFKTCTFQVQILDKEAPAITCPKNLEVFVKPDSCEAKAFWPVVQAFDNCDTTVLFAQTQTPSGSVFQIGTNTVTYTAADKSGNSFSCNFIVLVRDTIKPSITCPANIVIELPLTKCDTVATWQPLSVKDNCGVNNVTTTNLPGSKFNAGTTMVTYTVEDKTGNKQSCSFSVTAKDFLAPKFDKCLKDTTINTTDSCGTIVNFVLPTATDNCSPKDSLKYSSTSQPGTLFQVGITKVAITVADLSGNTDKCEFNITVKSSAVPKFINVPTDITINGCSGVATWTEPKAIGICQPVLSKSHEPGATFPIGTTVVTYTAKDINGNTYTSTFKVIVSEKEPPKFTNCPTHKVEVDISGKIISDSSKFLTDAKPSGDCKGAILSFPTPAATDNCGIVTVEQTMGNISTDTFPTGMTQVVFTASDAAGNSLTCAVKVTVLGLVQPDITSDVAIGCPDDDIVLSVKNPAQGATYIWDGPKGPHPNGTSLEIIKLDDSKAGKYTVKGVIGGCETAIDSFIVVIAKKPDAMNDLSLQIDKASTATFDLTRNDIINPAGDFVLRITCPITGLVVDTSNAGSVKFTAPNITGAKFSSCYEICSKSCPKLCDMATITITVRDTECEFVPNVITPNGDNENDGLLIPCLDLGLFDNTNSIVIYNQWGDKVFEASPYDNANPWKGTLKDTDKPLPDGTYFYIFNPGPNTGTKKGFVEILR